MRKHRAQRGDTIIEVLLSMSIIGMVLGSAFGIANRSVRLGEDAQERTEALKIAESQLEIFKTYYNSSNPSDSAIKTAIRAKTESMPFCIDNNEVILSTEDKCKNKNGSGGEGLYSISIIPPGLPPTDNTGAFEIKVTWIRLGATSATASDNISSTSLYYKPGSL